MKLDKTIFRTELVAEKPSKSGIDKATFMTAINPGSPLKHLNRIASGGELSRFLLAVKLCLINDHTDKSQIFDEIDSGVGGATADAVGQRLRELARGSQILVVTHSPQVAALGNHHIKVVKTRENTSSTINIVRLNSAERVDEIGRMLSGGSLTAEAQSAAKVLLRG